MFPLSPYIVGPNGQASYQTIQSAINSAAALGGGTIYVQPGHYRENLDLTNINVEITVVGAVGIGDEGQCKILGTHKPPLRGTFAFRNFRLTSENAIFESENPGEAHLVILDSYLDIKNGYTFNLPNWKGIFEVFDVNPGSCQDGGVNNRGGATLLVYSSGLGRGDQNEMYVSGVCLFQAAEIGCPINALNQSSLSITNAMVRGNLKTQGNSSGVISNSFFVSGEMSAIVHHANGKLSVANTTIQSRSPNPIIGNDQLKLGSVTFLEQINMNNFKIDRSSSMVTGTINAMGLNLFGGTNARIGLVNLQDGFAKVLTEQVTDKSCIKLTSQKDGGTPGFLRISDREPGNSFTITSSSNSDSSLVSWVILEFTE